MQPRSMKASAGQSASNSRPYTHNRRTQELPDATEKLSNHPSIPTQHAQSQIKSPSTVSQAAAGTQSQFLHVSGTAAHTSLTASPGDWVAQSAHRAQPANRRSGVCASTATTATDLITPTSVSVSASSPDAWPSDMPTHLPLASQPSQTPPASHAIDIGAGLLHAAQLQRPYQGSVARRTRVAALSSNLGAFGTRHIAGSGVLQGSITSSGNPARQSAQAATSQPVDSSNLHHNPQVPRPVPTSSQAITEISGGRPAHAQGLGHTHTEGAFKGEACNMYSVASSNINLASQAPNETRQLISSQANHAAASLHDTGTAARSEAELLDLSMFGALGRQTPQLSQSDITTYTGPPELKDRTPHPAPFVSPPQSRVTSRTTDSRHRVHCQSPSDNTVDCGDWSTPGTGICSGSEGNSSSPASGHSGRTSARRTADTSSTYTTIKPTNSAAAYIDLTSPTSPADHTFGVTLTSQHPTPERATMRQSSGLRRNSLSASSRQIDLTTDTPSRSVANTAKRANLSESSSSGTANTSYLRRHLEQAQSTFVTSLASTARGGAAGQERETAAVSGGGTRLPSYAGYQGSSMSMLAHQQTEGPSFLADMTTSEQQLLQEVEDAQLALAISRSLQDTGPSSSSTHILEDMLNRNTAVTDGDSLATSASQPASNPGPSLSRNSSTSAPSIYSRISGVSRDGRQSFGLRQRRADVGGLTAGNQAGTGNQTTQFADSATARHSINSAVPDAVREGRLHRPSGSPVRVQMQQIRFDAENTEYLQRFEQSDLADEISDLLQQQARLAHSLANSLREHESLEADENDASTAVIDNPGRLSLDNPDGNPAELPGNDFSDRHVMSRSDAEALVAAVMEDGPFLSFPRPQLRNRRRRGIDGREHPFTAQGLAAFLSHATHSDSDSSPSARSHPDHTNINTSHAPLANNSASAATSQGRAGAARSSAITNLDDILAGATWHLSPGTRILEALRPGGRADWLLDLAEADDHLSYEWMSQLEDVKVPTPQHVLDRLPVTRFHRLSNKHACFDGPCPICVDDFKERDPVMMLPCAHGFHSACIRQWLGTYSKFCPVCKACVLN